MGRKALYDSAGVLKSHGFVDFTAGPGELVRTVAEDYPNQPGHWRWNGVGDVAVAPTPSPRDVNLAAFVTEADALARDATIPLRLKTLVAALQTLLE